jgi:hypothetical protein
MARICSSILHAPTEELPYCPSPIAACRPDICEQISPGWPWENGRHV